MNREQFELVNIIKRQLFKQGLSNTERPNTEQDWKEIISEAKQQAVFPYVFEYSKEDLKKNVSSELYHEYEILNYTYLAKAIRNLQDHLKLHELLSGKDIPYVILKGQASSMYYPEPILRASGDIDFLIDKNDIDKTDIILRQEGFSRIDGSEKHAFHWEYSKGDSFVEMHWNIPGVPENDSIVKKYASDIVSKANLINSGSGSFYVPSAFHHGLVLLLHTLGHLTSSGIGLRHLCDWLVFENSFTDAQFTEIFEKPLREIGILKFAQVMTETGIRYFGCGKRKWCETIDDQLCEAFLEDIFDGGNFGRKNSLRKTQTKFIRSNSSRKITDGNVLYTVFTNLNFKAKEEYPCVKKHCFLMPVGWGLVIIRYIWLLITGRRVYSINEKNVGSAVKRQRLYSELSLFEKDIENN